MMEHPQAAWLELFPPEANAPLATVRLRVLRRGGEPFLYLPTRNRAAARALDLYPAQTRKARLAKSLLQAGYRFSPLPQGGGLPFSLPRQNVFLAWLAIAARQPADRLPGFAVLAGNPHAPGRRFVFLLFNETDQPVMVVKAGCSERARELIARETAILRECGGKVAGVPALREEFIAGKSLAFATDYIAGSSPDGSARAELETLLAGWLDRSRKIPPNEIPAWQRLIQSEPTTSWPEMINQLGRLPVCPALMHGDLAPWNVKVTAGRWTVLDWERGEQTGMPGWDWLHFVLQPAVLVQHESVEKILIRVEQLFASEEFGRYAKLAGIAGQEWPLTIAYVKYCLSITQQTEGIPLLKRLLPTLQTRAALTT